MLDDGEVEGRVVGSHAAFVVTKVLLRRRPLARQPLRVGDLDRPEKTVKSQRALRRREQECRRPDSNDCDERRKQWALVPVVDQGERSHQPSHVRILVIAPSSLQEVGESASRSL